jgi:Asp-tRNA(Asn)/Glu-tRNA(Gln) amidotransferase A subunit family amidase
VPARQFSRTKTDFSAVDSGIGGVPSRSNRNADTPTRSLSRCIAFERGDPYAAPMAECPFLEAIARPPRKLRIALMLKDHRGVELHPECLEAVQRAAKLCASLGHIVEEADPGLDMLALRPMNARISAANTARSCYMRWSAGTRA